ncbi:SDR family oxidoreductase [Fulvivirgaceae bacterium BMA12]|uniref:SDR family oxidoreductase n=1 Tax=Agaribacillus aureus TaxID=3051825 RepID=A0ABT8L5V3_9BACT|nr:SDR family oxidoreductase [Fulvivirgaceae bacterium BMA12]
MGKEIVLILGGSGGMGLATAKILIEKGYKVIISGRTKGKLASISNQLGKDCTYVVLDASNNEDLNKTLSSYSKLDHIVVTISARANASGINNTSEENAKQAFQRFWISYNVLHFATEFLKRNGSVTLISGSSAKTPLKGYGVWGTLHGSLNGLVKQASIDIAPIRVNAISPGGIGINADRQLTEHRGMVEDIGQMVYAVISNLAVTSTIIDVDGGERIGTWNG